MQLCTVMSKNDTLMGIHLNDNSIMAHSDPDFTMQILELFIPKIDESVFRPHKDFKHTCNGQIHHPSKLMDIYNSNG